MELWIRSQDKEALRKINCSLYLKRDLSDYAEGEVFFIVSSGDKLGEYKSKERALEVLDEIQNKLISYLSEFNDSGITLKEVSKVVYEMPEN